MECKINIWTFELKKIKHKNFPSVHKTYIFLNTPIELSIEIETEYGPTVTFNKICLYVPVLLIIATHLCQYKTSLCTFIVNKNISAIINLKTITKVHIFMQIQIYPGLAFVTHCRSAIFREVISLEYGCWGSSG